MPDIASIPPTSETADASANAAAGNQSKTLINFKIQPAVETSVPSPVSSSRTAGGSSRRFSYTKSWGEVSDTLRKKLRERLSALKESDDTSGEDDRVYRSDTGAESRDLTPESREKSPESGAGVSAVRQMTAELTSSSSPPSCSYLFGAAASCRQPVVAKLNRTGTAFLGVPVTPRVSRSVTPRRTPGSSLRSITPDRAEYRSLASFIRRSATPDRVLASRAGPRGLPSPPMTEDVSNVTTSSPTPQQLQRRSDSGQSDPAENVGYLDHGRQQKVEEDQEVIKSGAGQVDRSADVEGLLVDDSVKKSLDLLDDSIENRREVSEDEKNTSVKKGEDGSSFKPSCEVEVVHVSDNGVPETISLKHAESESKRTGETGSDALAVTSECKDDANTARTTPKTALTHFIEVTSLEDGMKRITYVENGVILDVPAKVGNGRGTFSKKKSPPRADVIVKEEDGKRSPSSPAVDDDAAVSNDAISSPSLSNKHLKEASDTPSKTKSKSCSSVGIKHKKSVIASINGPSTKESNSKGTPRSLTQPLTIKTESSHYLDSSHHASVYCSPTFMAGASEAMSSAEASSLPSILEAGGGLLSQMSLLSVAETTSLPEVPLPIPGAHTGAVPKRRTWRQLAERRDTQVVKFPKNRSRGQNPADVAIRSDVTEELTSDASRRRRSMPVKDGSSDVACNSVSTAVSGIADSEVNKRSKNGAQGTAAPRESRGVERRKRASGESTASRKSLETSQGRDKTAQSSLRKNSSKNKTRPLPEEPDENPRGRNIETDSKYDETTKMPDVAEATLDAAAGGLTVVPGGGTNLSTSSGVRSGIARGSVAKKQALYESIGEVQAQKSPAVALGQPDHVGEHAEEETADDAPTQENRLADNAEVEAITGDIDVMKTSTPGAVTAAVMAAGVEDADEDDEDQRISVFRIRRSALEALRYRIPQTRDIVRTRFRSKELSASNADDAVGSTSPDLPTGDWLQRDPPADVISDLTARDPANPSAALTDDGKHSLLQFAMLHFRDADEKYNMLRSEDGDMNGSLKHGETKAKKQKKKSKDDWTWREQVEMVKWSSQPLEVSLLKLESADMNRMSLECFLCIQRYMGDQPMAKTLSEVDCVYSILMSCHRSPALRDEVFCQLMRQTTSNKSHQSDSCQRGWRLFSIVAAYFGCSDQLRPYLFKYLEVAAYDKRRGYHGTALVCLQNLRKTFRFGGRKNVPSIEEITAITAGRNSKRQIYRLPGGTERVINTKSTSVVQDIIEEICGAVRIGRGDEMDEFSLYCIVEGDTFTMPLAREEYILDVTTELQKNQQIFYLIFCRSVWYFPLRLDSDLYVEVVFNQITPDYLEGLLLVMPGETLQEQVVYDISRVAALLHRAADMQQVPTMKETKYLLPKAALMVRDIKPPQWVNMVQSNWQEVQDKTPMEAKSSVLEILESWPLFGSSFFAVSRVTESRETVEHILALNRGGVHFLDTVTHETLAKYPFSEVISTRKVKTEDGSLFLDMKYGNLMLQKVVRIQSDNAHEISRLIRQYISIEQKRRPADPAMESGRDGQASR